MMEEKVLLVLVGVIVWLAFFRGGGQEENLGLANIPDWITVDLIPKNPYSRVGTPLEQVNGVVVHYVANAGTSAAQNRNYFAGLAQSQQTKASSNFIIGLDGEIVLCVPPGEVAYASAERNWDTLSIECCHPDETGALNDVTYQSLVKLVAWLQDVYGFDTDQIIRHFDVTGKPCPLDFVNNPDKWEAFLADVEKANV